LVHMAVHPRPCMACDLLMMLETATGLHAHADLYSDFSGNTPEFYKTLLGAEHPHASPAIIFGWWPQSEIWSWRVLVQSSTRCLPAVRPGLDLVALPCLPEVQALWECWSLEHGLHWQQALWFSPCLGKAAVEDPALEVGREVLTSIVAMRTVAQQPVPLMHVCLWTAFATTGLLAEASLHGIPIVGDLLGQVHSPCAQRVSRARPHTAHGRQGCTMCPLAVPEKDGCADEQSSSTPQMVRNEPCTCFFKDETLEDSHEAAQQINQTLMPESSSAADLTGMQGNVAVIGGTLAVHMWANRTLCPVDVSTLEYHVPSRCTMSIKNIMNLLQSEELLWDGDDGVIVYQYAPGSVLAFAVASRAGTEAVEAIRAKLERKMLEHFGQGKVHSSFVH